MRHKKIIQLCKTSKRIALYGDGRDKTQWIGNGVAVYPLFDLPAYSCDSLCRSYDITEKQAESITMDNPVALPESICFEDVDRAEMPVEQKAIDIIIDGKVLRPLQTQTGVVFIEARYLEPFADLQDIALFERGVPGATYFAVKLGMILIGIITPHFHINDNFLTEIGNLASGCRVAVFNAEK